MRIRRRPQPTPPLSDLLPPAPPRHDAPPLSAAPPSTFPPRAVLTPPSLHPKKDEEEEEEDREGRPPPLAQVMRGKQQQEEVGGAHKTGNIGGDHSTSGIGSSEAKVEDDGGISDEGDDEKKAGVFNGAGGGGRKRRRRPAALMEGSRCSRVNGRGWRCRQQTLVGYSLCEHHLGKGRLRSVSSVRCNGAGRRKGGRDAGGEPPKPRQRGRKLGMVKARSISSLLHQTDQAADADNTEPAAVASGQGEGIGATV